MNSDFDREIDRLLRGRAARGGDALPGGPTRGNGRDAADGDGAHLDADELSAYAENALPPPTRLRFAAHLADCDRCRKIATGIVLSSGVAAELERREAEAARPAAAPSPSWRARLAALLSPRVLRFAAPALAICLVGAVAFVALRQSPQSLTDIARQTATQPRESAPAAPTGTLPEAGQSTTGTTNSNLEPGLVRPGTDDANTQQKSFPDQQRTAATAGTDAAPPAPAPAPVVADTATVAPLAGGAGAPAAPKAADEIVAQPSPRDDAGGRKAAEPDPRSAAQAESKEKDAGPEAVARVYSGAANTTNVQQQAPKAAPSRRGGGGADDDAGYAQQRRNDSARDEVSRAGERNTVQREVQREELKASPEPAARRRQARPSPPTASQGTAADTEPREETRSAGGRQFRRQGSAWVDTAYRSQPVTTLSRGSERYRALVADEPDIDRIARQLGGEVLLVWKGRAYRIR